MKRTLMVIGVCVLATAVGAARIPSPTAPIAAAPRPIAVVARLDSGETVVREIIWSFSMASARLRGAQGAVSIFAVG